MVTYLACTASLVRIKGFMGGLLGGDDWGALYKNKGLLQALSLFNIPTWTEQMSMEYLLEMLHPFQYLDFLVNGFDLLNR